MGTATLASFIRSLYSVKVVGILADDAEHIVRTFLRCTLRQAELIENTSMRRKRQCSIHRATHSARSSRCAKLPDMAIWTTPSPKSNVELKTLASAYLSTLPAAPTTATAIAAKINRRILALMRFKSDCFWRLAETIGIQTGELTREGLNIPCSPGHPDRQIRSRFLSGSQLHGR